jgi:hypothetical protein
MHEEGVTLERAIEIIYVQNQAGDVHEAAEAALGERFGELRIERDGSILVTVIDLTDADRDLLEDIGRDCGVEGWVRVRRADPGALRAWQQVSAELVRLADSHPNVLVGWPGPEQRYLQPPFDIRLSAHAVDVAARLYERFGEYVELTVGALHYPAGYRSPVSSRPSHPELDPAELRVELDGPLSVGSGHTTRHGLLLTNLGDDAVTVRTNGQLTAQVADPTTGRAVGGYAGPQIAPLILFTAAPGETVRIPLLVGTASYDVELGYAVPPGRWAVVATLDLGDGRTLRTPPLPLTVAGQL